MKINTKLVILLSTICLIIISNVRSYSERERVYQDVEIKPRVAHIQNNFEHVVKPLVERPFLPEEVEKLSDLKKRKVFYDEQMNTATIVGSPNAPAGRVENPSIYTSVFENHKTSVIHPVKQHVAIPLPNRNVAFNFSSEPGNNKESDQLFNDQISKSMNVGITNGNLGSDPTLKNYESPSIEKHARSDNSDETSFLAKKEKKLETKSFMDQTPSEAIENDIATFTKQFENTGDKNSRVKQLLVAKARLIKEAKELKEAVRDNLADLLQSKKLAIRLNNLVRKYEKKIVEDEKADSMKLADEITVKEMLKDKLHRELQGLRVSNSEYQELNEANPEDIDKIRKQILETIGSN